MGTVIVLCIIGALFVLSLSKTIKNSKKDGCGTCGNCPMSDKCSNK